jgi:hypothetical protein
MAIETDVPSSLQVDSIPEVPFYIPVTGPSTRPRRTLKYDDTFIVLDSHGDIGASAGRRSVAQSDESNPITDARETISNNGRCNRFCTSNPMGRF